MDIPRPEYPRPQLVRDSFVNLNGKWAFEIDFGKSGVERGLIEAKTLNSEIIVPFCPESELSGVGYKDFMECVWYKRDITIPADWARDDRKTLLHIGACDYRTELYVNGKYAGYHIGGFVSFSFDITEYVEPGENQLTLRVTDDVRAGTQPGGKQSHLFYSHRCVYTRTTGIWQTVWLENVPYAYIGSLKMTPDLEKEGVFVEAICHNAHGLALEGAASYGEAQVGSDKASVVGSVARLFIKLSQMHLWDTKNPNLYDLKLSLGGDSVSSYFGMRSVAFGDGKFYLNGKSVFQRLILDQGFYPDGILTAPTDEHLRADIQMSMDMGFNGARLHQKIFEPRFLYHCDKMGYMVWGEHGNWRLDISKPEAWQGFLPEWLETLERDYSHPAIIGWCPVNETQFNQNPNFVKMLVDMTHAYDPTRPVIDASGWTHVGQITDVMDIHDYEQNPDVFKQRYDKLKNYEALDKNRAKTLIWTFEKGTRVMVEAVVDKNKRMIFVSEYGGIWWSETSDEGWGYGNRPKSREEFIARYKGLTEALLDNPAICALCYTQLTDVEQEQNGLYTYDRKPKADPKIFYDITSKRAAVED